MVTVGNVNLIVGRVKLGACRLAKPGSVGAAGLCAAAADLQYELSVRCELQDLPVGCAVAGDPNEALVIDIDAVFILRPVVTLARAAPSAQQIACRIKLQYRGCRDTAFR